MQRIVLFIVGLILLSSCGIAKRGSVSASAKSSGEKKSPVPTTISVTKTAPKGFEKSDDDITIGLRQAYNDWKGIPYVLGGSSYNGVDCSAFMKIVFEDYFSVKLPRNTREQMKVGKPVKRRKVRKGDLVFFHTGRRTFHVGVMINDNEFLHASTSVGVTLSNLQSRYWVDAYLTSRRVL